MPDLWRLAPDEKEMNDHEDPPDEPEELTCDSCGAEILPDELYWTDARGQTLCEECIPPGAVTVGVRH